MDLATVLVRMSLGTAFQEAVGSCYVERELYCRRYHPDPHARILLVLSAVGLLTVGTVPYVTHPVADWRNLIAETASGVHVHNPPLTPDFLRRVCKDRPILAE